MKNSKILLGIIIALIILLIISVYYLFYYRKAYFSAANRMVEIVNSYEGNKTSFENTID